MNNKCYSENNSTTLSRKELAKKELFRKSIHACAAFVPVASKYFYWPVLIALFTVLVFYVFAEKSRLKGKPVPVISAITAAAARKRDANRFVLGPVTLASGVILCSLLWKPDAASVGIYALAFGDGLSSVIGRFFGKIKIPGTKGKSVAGSLTCFTAILISSFLVTKSMKFALILAVSGMIVEAFPLKDYDNVVIPVFVGGLAQFLYLHM